MARLPYLNPDDLAPEPVGLLLLEESADGDASYWVAYPNFYVITRYNKSRLYAEARRVLANTPRLGRLISGKS